MNSHHRTGLRTNNQTEGWHNRFQLVVGKRLLTIYKIIEEFKKEEADTRVMLSEIDAGRILKQPQRAKYRRINERLQRLTDRLLHFMRLCGHNINLGSQHIHGKFWLENALDVSKLENATVQELKAIAKNPSPNVTSDGIMRQRYTDGSSEDFQRKEELARLLVKVHRHTKCSPDFCLKQPKYGSELRCRFNFPFDIQDEPVIIFDEKTGEPLFFTKKK
ncbi:Protein translocase subunit SecD [Frankliniella fusca]|uniref:Protein translocase subunit SecD n=1 Tax=Frankliniella fusca TaxID=407009 RepID=A0AAE1L809_9NEOP|nr:Protein translocase subunit SecD [Frankliniella fusca]